MNAEEFQAFAEQLSEICEVQPVALIAVFACKGLANEAVALAGTPHAQLCRWDAVHVSDGRASYDTFAFDRGMLHVAVVAGWGKRVYEGFPIQNFNAYASRLNERIRPFTGVTARSRSSYLGWCSKWNVMATR